MRLPCEHWTGQTRTSLTRIGDGLHLHVGVTPAGTWNVWARCDGCGNEWQLGELVGARTLSEWYETHRPHINAGQSPPV
jgi:hypothetical protein